MTSWAGSLQEVGDVELRLKVALVNSPFLSLLCQPTCLQGPGSSAYPSAHQLARGIFTDGSRTNWGAGP